MKKDFFFSEGGTNGLFACMHAACQSSFLSILQRISAGCQRRVRLGNGLLGRRLYLSQHLYAGALSFSMSVIPDHCWSIRAIYRRWGDITNCLEV
jgi:hypothetical protein